MTSVLDDSRSDLDAALTNLSTRSSRCSVSSPAAAIRRRTDQRLANVTQNLVDHRTDLEKSCTSRPNAIANAYNIYDPDIGDRSRGVS